MYMYEKRMFQTENSRIVGFFFFFWLKTVIAKVLLQKYKLFLYMFCPFVLESKARYKAPEVMGA